MPPYIYSIAASLIISLGSCIGIFTFALKEEKLSKILLFFVSLASGAFMGGAFFHLLPEAVTTVHADTVFTIVLMSFIFFFFVEKILHWRHCHKGHCDVHTFGQMNLIGDGIHNFIDGLIIGGTFVASFPLGIMTSVTIALHEIPQEISDFGVLVYAGYSKKKALLANFLVALTIVPGSVLGIIVSEQLQGFIGYLLSFAAGGFIYIAASDLIPEIRKEERMNKSLAAFAVFLLGVAIAYVVKLFGQE